MTVILNNRNTILNCLIHNQGNKDHPEYSPWHALYRAYLRKDVHGVSHPAIPFQSNNTYHPDSHVEAFVIIQMGRRLHTQTSQNTHYSHY